MKGLFIKDLEIILVQKMMFVLIVAVGAFMLISSSEPAMVMSYITMFLGIFSVSTMSYDEYDNGMPFIVTLPMNRKDYVIEKYLFVFGISFLGMVISGIIGNIVTVFKIYNNLNIHDAGVFDLMIMGIMVVFVLMIFVSFIIPANIKYGVEKGRMIMIALMGAIGAIIVCLKAIIGDIDNSALSFIENLSAISLLLIIGIITIIVTFISVKISIKIMENKEY